jgi:dolichol kinase
MTLILTVLAVFILLLIGEAWWRRRQPHGEFTRKFVHITVGSFVAFWPYFLTPTDIKLLSMAFLAGTALSRYLNIFRAIHSVQRPTLGEFWFALVVGLLAFDLSQPHIFTVALLEMSLADGLAAVIGTRFGNGSRYTVFGSPKSVVGTATFFIVSCLILGGYAAATPSVVSPALLIPSVSLVATILENVAVRGLDNLVIPLFVAASLAFFS